MSLGITALLILFAAQVQTQAQVQGPELSLESFADRTARLRARSASADNLNLEGSFNLETWFPLGSQTPKDGTAQFEHTQEWPADAIYYRLRVGPPPAPTPRVIPVLDTEATKVGLLTPDRGLRLELTTPQGVQFTFTAGSNLVVEPVPIRMTVISNFTSFPTGAAWTAAVALEPDGLELRGNATLRITHPKPVPATELLAYSFSGDGSGFHLRPWQGTTNSVVLDVDGFSGKGVGSFPGGPPSPFNKAWDRSQDGERAARDRAAHRQSDIIRDYYAGKISEEEADIRQKASDLQELNEIYRDAIRPYEKAAANNCAIGRAIVLFSLEKLADDWAARTRSPRRESPFWKKILEIAPAVRCRCAQELIDRCEKEAGVSGSALLDSMRDLLSDTSYITESSDAQGCALGSDDQILAALQAGPCFGEWEGTITLTRIKTTVGEKIDRFRTSTWDDERREIYHGRVSGIKSQRTFTVGGRRVQTWTLNTVGTYSAGERVKQVITTDDPNSDVIHRITTERDASETPPAFGEISLRFENGAFDGLGCGGGTDPQGPNSNLKYTTTTTTSYTCKPSYPPDRECPEGNSFSSDSNTRLFMGFFVDPETVPPVEVQNTARSFRLTWVKSTPRESDCCPPSVEEERIVVDLARKP